MNQLYAEPSPSILLVDDKTENLFVLEKLLKKLEVNLLKASSGNEALSVALQQENLILVLLDVNMPGMDGYETCRQIRRDSKLNSKVPIIAMTALAMQGDYDKCMLAGMNGYITKPINFDKLIKLITETIQK